MCYNKFAFFFFFFFLILTISEVGAFHPCCYFLGSPQLRPQHQIKTEILNRLKFPFPVNIAVFLFSGKYGRHAGLPFLRPPLTTALLTLGKAQQVTVAPKSLWDFSSCPLVDLFYCDSFCSFFSLFTLQSAMVGNRLVLQNLLHMQLAQQQLLHIKDKRISSVRHLFVCAPRFAYVSGGGELWALAHMLWHFHLSVSLKRLFSV